MEVSIWSYQNRTIQSTIKWLVHASKNTALINLTVKLVFLMDPWCIDNQHVFNQHSTWFARLYRIMNNTFDMWCGKANPVQDVVFCLLDHVVFINASICEVPMIYVYIYIYKLEMRSTNMGIPSGNGAVCELWNVPFSKIGQSFLTNWALDSIAMWNMSRRIRIIQITYSIL